MACAYINVRDLTDEVYKQQLYCVEYRRRVVKNYVESIFQSAFDRCKCLTIREDDHLLEACLTDSSTGYYWGLRKANACADGATCVPWTHRLRHARHLHRIMIR